MEFNTMYRICTVISCLFEIYFLLDYYNAFHRKRKFFQDKKRVLAVYCVCVLLNVVVNWQNNSLLNMVVVQFLYMALLVIVFEGTICTWLARWLLALLVGIGAEFILIMFRFISVDLPNDQRFTSEYALIGSYFCLIIIKFILYSVMKQVSKSSSKSFHPKMFANYIIIPFATLGIMMFTPYVHVNSENVSWVDVILICSYILILLGNVRLYYIFEQYNYIKEQQLKQEVAVARFTEKQWHYHEVERIDKRYSVLIHNIKHYLKQIGLYAKENQTKEILNTLKDLQVEFMENESQDVCSHGLLNSLLVDWREKAKKRGVDVNIFVEVGFKIEFMKGVDIMAVFGNLLDNVLEATEKCSPKTADIKLFMQNDGAFSVIRVSNNYNGKIEKEGDRVVTSKKDKENHGIGIQNIKETIVRYDGYVDIDFNDREYTTTIVVPVPLRGQTSFYERRAVKNKKK